MLVHKFINNNYIKLWAIERSEKEKNIASIHHFPTKQDFLGTKLGNGLGWDKSALFFLIFLKQNLIFNIFLDFLKS